MVRAHDLEYEFEYEVPPPLLRIRVVHGRSWGADHEPARFGALGQRRAEAVTKALADEMKRQVARLPAASRPRGHLLRGCIEARSRWSAGQGLLATPSSILGPRAAVMPA